MVLRDQARLTLGDAGRADGGQVTGLLGLGTGVAQGCERWDLSARLFGWDSGRSQVRWCQGLGCWGGGPGGGCAVLSGGGCGLVLLGGHGRVGGMVAWVWRSLVVSFGQGENMFYLRTDRQRRGSLPS